MLCRRYCHNVFPWSRMSAVTWKISFYILVTLHCVPTKKANVMNFNAATSLIIFLKLDSNHWFFSPRDLKIWWKTSKNNMAPLLYIHQALCIISNPSVNSDLSYSPETLNLGQNLRFLSRVTLEFDGWHWKNIGHPFFGTLSFVHHFRAIGEFKLVLQFGNPQFG